MPMWDTASMTLIAGCYSYGDHRAAIVTTPTYTSHSLSFIVRGGNMVQRRTSRSVYCVMVG
jgi:hypothetical protein